MALVEYNNEYKTLKQVALYRPSLDEISQGDPSLVMYQATPNPETVLAEFDAVVNAFEKLGVKVIVLSDIDGVTGNSATPNMIYLRDVAMVYRQTIMLARMKHPIRANEPDKFKRLLVTHTQAYENSIIDGMKVGTLEGADVMAFGKRLLVYTGSRTSDSALGVIRENFTDTDVVTVKANIDGVPQHLLGGVHVVDSNLALRRVSYCKDEIDGLNFIDLEEVSEVREGFAMNIVTVGPRQVLMPANRPETKQKLEKHGIVCHEVKIEEIHKMGGGLACMTLPLKREVV